MYLHIGHNWLVPYRSIVAIFNYDLIDSSAEFRHLFHRLRVEGQVFGEAHGVKTLVMTETSIYLSTISSGTLMRRVERQVNLACE